MPIRNLGNAIDSGSIYVDRSVQAPQWTPFPRTRLPEGATGQAFPVKGYLRGDIASVETVGSFNRNVFTVAGTGLDMVVTATPRAAVTADTDDSITLRATGEDPGGGLSAGVVNNTLILTTLNVPKPRIWWTGTPARAINESTTISIPLANYIIGIPDNTFDSIAFVSKQPQADWITLTNREAANAALAIAAPAVESNQTIEVVLRVTKSTAEPSTDDISFAITVLNLTAPVSTGLNVLRWDVPNMKVTGGTFRATVLFDNALSMGDTLTPADFYVDGLPTGSTGITITSVTKDDTNDALYILNCTAAPGIEGVITFGFVRA